MATPHDRTTGLDKHRGHDRSIVLPFTHDNSTPSVLLAKRLMDTVGAAVLLVLTAPVWIVAAIAIKLDSRGPVFFVQERVGARPLRHAGRVRWVATTFMILKFRSMTDNADQDVHRLAVKTLASGEVLPGADASVPYKLTADPRVTRVGALLRRTSIDELPQLLNVLAGHMSLVGPRPLPSYEVEEYQPWHFERLCAKPGITGLWQVEGRGTTSFDEGTRLDITYVRRRTLLIDVQLLLRTIPLVLRSRGAR